MRFVFNKKKTRCSVPKDADDRLADFHADNTPINSSPGRLHHSYFNNGFHQDFFFFLLGLWIGFIYFLVLDSNMCIPYKITVLVGIYVCDFSLLNM